MRPDGILDTRQGLYYLACGSDRTLSIDASVHLIERRTGMDRIIGKMEDYLHVPAAGACRVAGRPRDLYTRYMDRGSDLTDRELPLSEFSTTCFRLIHHSGMGTCGQPSRCYGPSIRPPLRWQTTDPMLASRN